MSQYDYTISTAFPNGVVDPSSLRLEILESSITTVFDFINTDVVTDQCSIFFQTDLSGAEQTTLDGLVAAHTGVAALALPSGTPGWNLRVEDRNLTVPPGTPIEGLYYIVATGGTGDWAGCDDCIAGWNGTTWQFQLPTPGLAAWVFDENIVVVYVGATERWSSYGSPTGDLVFGTDPNLAQSTATSTTTSTSWQTKITMNTTTLAGGNYELKVTYGWSSDTTQYDFEAQVRQGATVLGQIHKQEAKDAGGSNGSTGTNQRYLASRRYILPLAAGSYTFDFQHRTSVSGNESSVWDAYMTLWRVS